MFKKIIIILIACAFLILLFAHIPDLIATRLISALWPIGHVICFSFLAWLLISFNAKIKSSNSQRQLLILLLVTLVVGCAIELIQPLFSRTFQLTDIYYNLFGALAIYLFFGNFSKPSKGVLIFRAIYTLTFLYLVFPAMQAAKDEYAMRVNFPILAKFDSTVELTRWKSDLPLSIINSRELPDVMHEKVNLMKATFASKDASRVVLRFFAGDWQGYESIKFSFFNPNGHVLQVRVIMTDRAYHQEKPNHNDRFEKWLMIKPGVGEFTIALSDIKHAPTERQMDLSEMAGIDFYMYHLPQPLVLYISKVELLLF